MINAAPNTLKKDNVKGIVLTYLKNISSFSFYVILYLSCEILTTGLGDPGFGLPNWQPNTLPGFFSIHG